MTASLPVPAAEVEKLRRVRTFAQVFKYLVDERDWPLDADALDVADLKALTYDWDPEELGIPAEALGSLERLRQMRPVTAHQPWGVFFLEFSGARLPITMVRRILRALVTKKRSTADAGRPSWDLADLLFIVSTGAAGTVELHFIAFQGDNPATAEFRPLTWRPDSPMGHLRRLAEDLLPCLDWPDDDHDVGSWRAAWREAFKLPPGQAIRDAARLAERMASTGRDLREQIADALVDEAGAGPFSTLMNEVRARLVSDVDGAGFADMCAQTLVYGVLSSRVTDPDGFGSSPVFSSVPLANPFLEAFFEQIHDQAVALDIPGSGLPQLVADLRETNVEAILDQFGSTAKGGDPVIHFYEQFFKQYNPQERKDAGVFYTPLPVVQFMVRMVDEVLRTRFGLQMGIADTATWQEVADRNGFAVPNGVDPMQVLLTDTLDHRPAQVQFGTMMDPVAAEGERAADLKESDRFTVVIGNPPYDREHRATDDAGTRKGGVVRHGAPGIPALIEAVLDPMKDAGRGGDLVNVYNDYVYFWCWAVWQATKLSPGPGVVCFITASSYLNGGSMGGVRHMLRQAFDELWIVDLGGEGRGARTEDNVFDIRTPVAIAMGVQTGKPNSGGCVVRYLQVTGSQKGKLSAIRKIGLADQFVEVSGTDLDEFTPRSDSKYYDWPKIVELFPWYCSGSKVHRTWPIAETRALLKQRWDNLTARIPRERGILLRETRDRTSTSRLRPLIGDGSRLQSLSELDRGDPPEGYQQYSIRNFDRSWLISDNRVIDLPRPHLWNVLGPRQLFLTTRISSTLGRGPGLTVTPYIPDINSFGGRGTHVVPVYRDCDGRLPNLASGLTAALGKQFNSEVAPDELLSYVYAIAGTEAFGIRFDEELAEVAGPIHVPITADRNLFERAVELGRELIWWHTWGKRLAPVGKTRLPPGRAKEIAPVRGMPEKYNYDPAAQVLTVGTGTFGPVTPEVWSFEVSGLKVVNSWLGYRMKTRKGRKSSPLDKIRPTRWTQTDELLRLLAILDHTINLTPTAAALLDEILANPLIPATDLPTPTPDQRKPPKSP